MPMSRPQTTVIVACRNEAETIERCLTSLVAALPEAEIVVVDGGHDGTFERASNLAGKWPQIKLVRNVPDWGKGHAVQRGIAAASGRAMAQFDADLQFSAEDLPRLLEPIRAGEADVTLGSRFLSGSDRDAYGSSFSRDTGNRLLSLYVSLLIGRHVTDVTTGIKAWTREAIQRIDFHDLQYSYEAEIVVRAARLGLRLKEVPVSYAGRTAGHSMHRNHWELMRAGAVIALKALRTRFRKTRPGLRP